MNKQVILGRVERIINILLHTINELDIDTLSGKQLKTRYKNSIKRWLTLKEDVLKRDKNEKINYEKLKQKHGLDLKVY